MTPERWQQIEDLYHRALERDESQRAAFVRDACAGDSALREEVERLLAAEQQAGSFLEEPALQGAARELAAENCRDGEELRLGAEAAKELSGDAGQSWIARRIGPYDVISLLGVGGMGEVYRARDINLKRDVAVKVLPSALARDPDRLVRLRREAQLLASLNHSNIAAIYGLEEFQGVPCVVMELIPGETLADRIKRGPIPVDESLGIAKQIAEALEAAHEKGVVHRDLKPANIKVTPDGKVKVLDFGLAKAFGPVDVDLSELPTRTSEGVVLGTPAYMSPEQACGKPVDKRTDIWAFGCVLYEMLTGRNAFASETVSETIAAILEREPDWGASSEKTPPNIQRLLRRCLEKDPKRRLHDIADARIEIDDAPAASATTDAPARGRRLRLWIAATIALVAMSVTTLLALVWSRSPAATADPMRFTFSAPENETLDPDEAVPSPDGRRVAFVARSASGVSALWIRPLDSPTPQRIAGTDGAAGPFWSPDGRFVGFFAQGKLKKIDLSGGPAQNICNIDQNLGATWNRDGVIVLAPTNRARLFQVPATGGTPEAITSLDVTRHENSHRWPHFLPDARHFLYTARSDVKENTGIYVGSLDSKERKWLLAAQSNAVYAPPGYLLFVREGTLMAQRFDGNRLELSGDPFAVAGGVGQRSESASAFFAVAADGTVLTYQAAAARVSQLTWFDRTGANLGPVGPERESSQPRLSPDGRRVALVIPDKDSGNRDIWLMELPGGSATRLTSHPANDWWPVWSPDGAQVTFASDRNGASSLYRKAAVGAGDEELLWKDPEVNLFPGDWSADGRFLVVHTATPKGQFALWALPLFGDRKPFALLQTQFADTGPRYSPRYSPDGQWIAYVGDESGRGHVYVRPFGKPGERQISLSGGSHPVWRRDGRELFYIGEGNQVMAVGVNGRDAFDAGTPTALFRACNATESYLGAADFYDVAADGKRILVNCLRPQATPSSVTVAVHWAAGLRDGVR